MPQMSSRSAGTAPSSLLLLLRAAIPLEISTAATRPGAEPLAAPRSTANKPAPGRDGQRRCCCFAGGWPPPCCRAAAAAVALAATGWPASPSAACMNVEVAPGQEARSPRVPQSSAWSSLGRWERRCRRTGAARRWGAASSRHCSAWAMVSRTSAISRWKMKARSAGGAGQDSPPLTWQ